MTKDLLIYVVHVYFSSVFKIEKQAYGRTHSLLEFERIKHMSHKHMSVGVYINERTYYFDVA